MLSNVFLVIVLVYYDFLTELIFYNPNICIDKKVDDTNVKSKMFSVKKGYKQYYYV